MEELAYRGAWLGWFGQGHGVGPAVVGQAVVFRSRALGRRRRRQRHRAGCLRWHGRVIAGLIAVRTRSLLFPLAIHIGLDIPIYYAFACAS